MSIRGIKVSDDILAEILIREGLACPEIIRRNSRKPSRPLEQGNSRKENYPDDEAVSQVKEYLREKFIARVGLGLGNETANVDAELANTFAWAVDQYILNQLRDA